MRLHKRQDDFACFLLSSLHLDGLALHMLFQHRGAKLIQLVMSNDGGDGKGSDQRPPAACNLE